MMMTDGLSGTKSNQLKTRTLRRSCLSELSVTILYSFHRNLPKLHKFVSWADSCHWRFILKKRVDENKFVQKSDENYLVLLTKENISIQCNSFGHNNVATRCDLSFLHISRKKISCTKSWCKSDVDPARIRCCHQHRLSNKTYSAIPEQRTTRQLCFHWRTSQPLKQTGGSHSNEPDQDESANWHFLSFSELPVETYHHPKI